MIPRFIQAVINDKPPTVHGDGEQSRDFTFIGDLVNGIYKACHAERAAGEIINLACGRRISLNDLLDSLSELTKREINPVHTESRPGDVRDSLADISKARDVLGYEPQVSMADALAQTYYWYEAAIKNNGNSLSSDTINESKNVESII